MAGQNGGDNYFSDSELDELPGNALDELENNALLHTQHQTQATQLINVLPSSDYGDGLDNEDLDDADVFDEAQAVPSRILALQSPSTDPSTRREQSHKGRYGGPGSTSPLVDRTLKQKWTPEKLPTQQNLPVSIQQNRIPQSLQREATKETTVDPMIEALQKQVQELLQERDVLKQDLTTKAGEISIVRSKQEKAAKEYEREITAIKKLNAETLVKHQEAFRAATEAERNAATELEFVKQDLLEEAEKVRSLRRSKDKENSVASEPISTPKKNRAKPYGDGFDNDEIQIISPSKFYARRSNPSTPTKAGTKRKRKVQNSPVVSLEVEQPRSPQEEPAPAVILDEKLLERIRNPDDRLNFLELVIDHRPRKDQLRTFEALTKLAFPSAPKVSFASIIFEKLPTLNAKQLPSEFPIEFCELIISLWSRCIAEKYYKPTSLLIDLLTFCLELKTLAIAPFIIDNLLPVAQATAELIAYPRFYQDSYTQFENSIDISACLSILHLTAQGCMNNIAYTSRFWRAITMDFVLVILSPHQPVEDFNIMLQLLSMSTIWEGIGPLAPNPDPEKQIQAMNIIERVSLPLIPPLTIPAGSTKHNASIISSLRLQVLRTLEAFCQTASGGAIVAKHPNAIGRVVKLMSSELDALYDYRSGHKQSAQLVCLAMRILHCLTTKHEKFANFQEKLSRILGGNKKYLICLSRLNFLEDGLVLDADIGAEIQECAIEMLQLHIAPEEGDGIYSAFQARNA